MVVAAIAAIVSWRSDAAASVSAPAALELRWVAALVLAGLALRFPWIDPGPMDHLEYALTYEVEFAESPQELIWNRIGLEQAHQPLSRLPIWAALKLGLHAVAARWVSLVCWLGALAVACRLVPRLMAWGLPESTDRHWVAVAAVAAVAFSPLGVRYGFDVTPYGLLALSVWGAALGVVRILEGRRGAVLWAALAAGVGFYANYSALPCFAGVLGAGWLMAGVHEAAPRRVRRARIVLCGALFGLTVVPWIPAVASAVPLFEAYVAREAELYAMDFPPAAQAAVMSRIVTGLPALAAMLVLVGGPVLALIVGTARQRRAIVACTLPTACFAAFKAYQLGRYAAASGGTYFGARHFMPCLVFVLPCAVLAWSIVLRRHLGVRAVRTLVALVPLAALFGSLDLWRTPWRPDVRAATAHVREHLESGDAVGVLPRFFYSQGMLAELTQGQMAYALGFGWGFLEFPVAPADGGEAPVVWLVADDREYPLPGALENLAFERIWVLDYRETEFGIPELAPVVSDRTIAYMDARHVLLERREYAQLVLSLYRLRYDLEVWDGQPYEISEDNWREYPRQTSWTMPHGDRGLVYRYDLPAPAEDRDVTVTIRFTPVESQEDEAFDARLRIEPYVDELLPVPTTASEFPVSFEARAGKRIVVEIEFTTGMRVPDAARLE